MCRDDSIVSRPAVYIGDRCDLTEVPLMEGVRFLKWLGEVVRVSEPSSRCRPWLKFGLKLDGASQNYLYLQSICFFDLFINIWGSQAGLAISNSSTFFPFPLNVFPFPIHPSFLSYPLPPRTKCRKSSLSAGNTHYKILRAPYKN